MALTNFPNGITSFGVPVLGNIGGIPLTGTYYFVNPATGSDAYDGTSPETPFATLPAAYNATTAGNNDVIVLIGDGSTAGTARLTSTLTWAKNATHLIGVTAPTMISQRARISHSTTATTNFKLMNVTASGCIFSNFSLFQGVGQASTDEQLIDIAGDRNYFGNVQFGGMGAANGAGRAGSYSVYLNDGDENTFDGCTFGLDTISRSAANASVKFAGQSQRNVFQNCLFPMYATATSPWFIDANSVGSIDRFQLFKGCSFINTGTSTVAAVVNFNASQGGTIVLDNCTVAGASKWTASATGTVVVSGPVPNGATSGVAVTAA
jgi:hypothetical protein